MCLFIFSFLQLGFVSHFLALTIYMKTDNYQIGTVNTYRCILSLEPAMNLQAAPYYVDLNTSLNIEIINLDTIAHELQWNDFASGVVLSPLGSITLTRTFDQQKVYALVATDFSAKTLGGSFAVIAGVPAAQRYFWNLYEMQTALSGAVANLSQQSFPSPYRPNLFSINGYDYPLNMNDTLGIVNAHVGDSVYIAVLNSGNMVHTLHFHGYHFEILSSTKNPSQVAWKKDSAPVFPQDGMLLLLIPDKMGTYPVHDHNLTAVTTTGGYSGGMMSMLNVTP
mgnify:FL=1|jgi:hypothetical protein